MGLLKLTQPIWHITCQTGLYTLIDFGWYGSRKFLTLIKIESNRKNPYQSQSDPNKAESILTNNNKPHEAESKTYTEGVVSR